MHLKDLYSESHLCTEVYTSKQLYFGVPALARLLQLVVVLDMVALHELPRPISTPGAVLHPVPVPHVGQHSRALLGSD